VGGSAGFFYVQYLILRVAELEENGMAEKKAKTAEKSGVSSIKHLCPSCGTESKVTYFAGFGRRGFFWVCDKNCGYIERTR
jgi:hypothetical protein